MTNNILICRDMMHLDWFRNRVVDIIPSIIKRKMLYLQSARTTIGDENFLLYSRHNMRHCMRGTRPEMFILIDMEWEDLGQEQQVEVYPILNSVKIQPMDAETFFEQWTAWMEHLIKEEAWKEFETQMFVPEELFIL